MPFRALTAASEFTAARFVASTILKRENAGIKRAAVMTILLIQQGISDGVNRVNLSLLH